MDKFTINVINLPKREDRLLSFCNQARWQKFSFKIWSGIEDCLTPAQNINKAHKQIVRFAQENNHEFCFISEDDAIFTNENGWDYYLSQMPKSWDLYFTMLYSAEVKEGRVMNGFSGLTCYGVHNKFYQTFLSMSDTLHIDRALGVHCFEKEYFVCQPYVAKQMGGYSNNTRREENYRIFEENMKFY